MIKYMIKRLLILIPVFFGVTAMVFFLSNLAPGSPVDAMVTPEMDMEAIAALEEQMGLNQPIYVQYVKWLGRFAQGDLGHSFRCSREVIVMIGERVGPTLLLTGSVLVLAVVIGIALGILAAYRPYSVWDYAASGLSFIGVGVPNFFLALILIYIFSVKLGLLPTGGMYTDANHETFAELIKHMILPVSVLTISMVGNYIRQTRSAMLEVLGEEYIKMARVKGMTEKKICFVHALRNAMLPILTTIGMSVPFLVGGSVVVEKIFGWPGLGNLMVTSVSYRDYPVIMGIAVYICVVVLVVNLVVDLLYALLDPRIRNS